MPIVFYILGILSFNQLIINVYGVFMNKAMASVMGIICGALVLSGCDKPRRAPPKPEVVVKQVKQFPYKDVNHFVGRLTSASDVDIPARVKAKITSVNFKEGKDIQINSVLFQLDDTELQAQLKQVKAQVTKAKTSFDVALKNLKRGEELINDGYISSSEMDDLRGKADETRSTLQSVQAQLETAQVNLSYTQILAPISGRTGRSKYSVGDLVGPDSGALTTIVALNNMEVPFQISENDYWRIVQKYQAGTLNTSSGRPVIKISINNQLYPYSGAISFLANRVDTDTGTIEVRATVPNPKGILKPGQYVKVIVESPIANNRIMIEQSAVQSDQQGDFVMTLVEDNIVARRNVQLGKRVDTLVIVEKGLTLNEKIITRGVQQIRNGQAVNVKSSANDLLKASASSATKIAS